MQRLVIVARIREGAGERATELLAGGPPYDPSEWNFQRHAVYLTDREVVFLFEGPDVEWQVDDLMSDFRRPAVRSAIEAWKPLLDGQPQVAREAYFWDGSGAGGGGAPKPGR